MLLLSHFSHVRLFATPQTVAHQASKSMDSLGKSTGVDCHSFLQRIFPTHGSNPGIWHCRQIPYHLSYQGSSNFFEPLFWGAGQEYWSGLPFPSPGDLPYPKIKPGSPSLQADCLQTEPPGKPKNTGEGKLSLRQEIFPTQGPNPGLLHCRQILGYTC